MKKVTFCFGRFQVPTKGHQKLFDFASEYAKKENTDFKIYTTHTTDNKDNPLSYTEKIYFLKKAFPSYKENIRESNAKTIFDVLKKLELEGYDDVTLVVGKDRVEEFKNLFDDYINKNNTDPIKLSSYQVISAGDRKDGISASKLRDIACKQNDYYKFAAGLPTGMDEDNAKKLYVIICDRINTKINEDSKMEKEYSPLENPSRMWQSFRKWFYTMDEASKPESEKKEEQKINPHDYLIFDKKTGKGHWRVRKNGKLDHRLMGAAHRALTKKKTDKEYKGPDKSIALNRLRALYKKEKLDLPGK